MPDGDRYEIEVNDQGTFDVRRNGRAFAYDLDDLDESLGRIRRAEGRGFYAFLIDDTGYRTRVRT